jgi:hypothetical protein
MIQANGSKNFDFTLNKP